MDLDGSLFGARASYGEGDEEFNQFQDSDGVWAQENDQIFSNQHLNDSRHYNQEDETDFESLQDESEFNGNYSFLQQNLGSSTRRVNTQSTSGNLKINQYGDYVEEDVANDHGRGIFGGPQFFGNHPVDPQISTYHDNYPGHFPIQSQNQLQYLSQGKPRLQPTPMQLNYNTQYQGPPPQGTYAPHFSQNFRQPPPYYSQQQYQQQQMPRKYRPMAQQFQQQQQFRQPPMHNPMGYAGVSHSQNNFPRPSNYVKHLPVGVSSDTRDGVPLPKLPHPPIVKKDSLVYMAQFKTEYRYFVISPFLLEEVKISDFVIVEAEKKGEDLGLVVEIISMELYTDRRKREERSGQFEEAERVLRYLLRIASDFDCAILPEKFHDETIVIERAKEIVGRILCLPMQVLDAEYQFDRLKLSIHYVAHTRVDFRELISKLFAVFRTCIWMKKVNTNLIFDARECDVISLRTGQLPLSLVIAQQQQQQQVIGITSAVRTSPTSIGTPIHSSPIANGSPGRTTTSPTMKGLLSAVGDAAVVLDIPVIVRGGEDGYDSA